MKNLFDVSGKTVLITGSSKGLGLSFARGFAEAGAVVVMNGRDRERLHTSAEAIRRAGGRVHEAPFDVSDKAEVEAAVPAIIEAVGVVDVLVNNAGIQRRAPFEEMTVEDWKTVIDTNLTSAFIVTRSLLSHMIARKAGVIINITSLNAVGARPTISPYCAAKGGLTMLTKSMATELGKFGIRANAIGPGYFRTELNRKLIDDPAFDAWVKSEVPLARWGEPDELIGAALFLASDASSYVNGSTIFVDGGWQASL